MRRGDRSTQALRSLYGVCATAETYNIGADVRTTSMTTVTRDLYLRSYLWPVPSGGNMPTHHQMVGENKRLERCARGYSMPLPCISFLERDIATVAGTQIHDQVGCYLRVIRLEFKVKESTTRESAPRDMDLAFHSGTSKGRLQDATFKRWQAMASFLKDASMNR
ncbi:hypothetical protein SCLCIDRAFT_1213912 [Scleroderma citrinum Foug A]|uniref:Uncharacterized protein n=1 Tax=Scleroderma citrinum Foug A TaxID=1036808 RepID=A0A0C3AFP4_9AGAM|nr:hypothetical protein SCLCIDRAFT_1213912 [Scleroderma citrinum Foug A]